MFVAVALAWALVPRASAQTQEQPKRLEFDVASVKVDDISMLSDPVNTRVKFQQRTMSDFAGVLGSLIATSQGLHPGQGDTVPRVLDMTGLTGIYTFTIEYSCPRCDTRPAAAGDPGSGKPELFQAIRRAARPCGWRRKTMCRWM